MIAADPRAGLAPVSAPCFLEKDYAIAVALRYNVASLNGFLLGGTPDNGSFNPLLLQVEQPNIRFAIEPAGADNPMDKCDTHSRESFHELTTLLNLKLFVDFPTTTTPVTRATCRMFIPQRRRWTRCVPSSRRR